MNQPMMPPGGMPPELLAQLAAQQRQQPGGAPPPPPSRAKHNPLPPGGAGIKVLRGLVACPLATEAQQLEGIMDKIVQLPLNDEGEEELTNTLGRALASSIRAEKMCTLQLTTRTAAILDEDDELKQVHEEFRATQTRIEELNKELGETFAKVQELQAKRWSLAVKKYGLNPDERSYQFDEENGKIEQLDLDCDKCAGRTTIREIRQDIAAQMLKIKGGSDD